MKRDEILAVVKKHIAASVENVDAATIDTSRSIKDLGASSLDVVEVVSATMRDLKVKIPRPELVTMTNIDDLVTRLEAELAKQP